METTSTALQIKTATAALQSWCSAQRLPSPVATECAKPTALACIQAGRSLPTLSGMERDSEERTRNLLIINLSAMAMRLNAGVKRGLTAEDVEDVADALLDPSEGFKYAFNFADIGLIIKRITRGYYGETYESITCGKVLGWFRAYRDERLDEAARASQREGDNHKHEGRGGIGGDAGALIDSLLHKQGRDVEARPYAPSDEDKRAARENMEEFKRLTNSGLDVDTALGHMGMGAENGEKAAESRYFAGLSDDLEENILLTNEQ